VHQLRQLADELEATGKARTILVVIDDGANVNTVCLGYRPRRSETLGLLAFAQQMIYEQRG
jgi:hypothetical protein